MFEQLSVKWLCLFYWIMLWGWRLHPTGDRVPSLVGKTRRSALRATWEPGRLPEPWCKTEAGVPAGPTLLRWPNTERRLGLLAKARGRLPTTTAGSSDWRTSSGGASINSHRPLINAFPMTKGHKMTLEAKSSTASRVTLEKWSNGKGSA